MSYHPRIECEDIASFQTVRSRNSELWFVNNPRLEEAILGYLACYSVRYEARVYAISVEGNHIQLPAHFPRANRAQFMRDFNSSVARAIPRFQPEYPGGRFWGRRYSAEYLPGNEDIEDRFFYTVLQPVNDGLVDDIKDYPGYNCFEDAITGRKREFKVVRWKQYHDAKRWKPNVSIEDFTEVHQFSFARLPGYEALSQVEYAALMRRKLAQRTEEVLKKRAVKKPLGSRRLRAIRPGALPRKTKISGRNDHRPRILSKSASRRSVGQAWYFEIYFDYRRASARYRAGDSEAVFPKGTYKPPLFTVSHVGTFL